MASMYIDDYTRTVDTAEAREQGIAVTRLLANHVDRQRPAWWRLIIATIRGVRH